MPQPFNPWPPYIIPQEGCTARSPSGTLVGIFLQQTYNHIVNWRYNGIHVLSTWPAATAVIDHTSYMYPIFHMPPKTDTGNRGIAVGYALWRSGAGGAWALKFEDVVAGAAAITLADGDNGSTVGLGADSHPWKQGITPAEYTPPDSGAVNLHRGNFKACRIELDNVYPASISIWHIDTDGYLDDSQVQVKVLDVMPGRTISELSNSLTGLFELAGDGSDDVESLERLSRRVFFNEIHTSGIYIAGGTAWTNIVNDMVYFARCRNLVGDNAEIWCYPAFVVTITGLDATHTGWLRVTTTATGTNVWEYEFNNGVDPTATPFLITFDRAGATPATGVQVKSSASDSATVEASTDAGVTITIHSWALFEGPAF